MGFSPVSVPVGSNLVGSSLPLAHSGSRSSHLGSGLLLRPPEHKLPGGTLSNTLGELISI